MDNLEKVNETQLVNKHPAVFLIVAFIAGAFIWITDAVVDVYMLGEEEHVIENIFEPEPTELWMRTLVVIVLLAVGFYARISFQKQLQLNKLLFHYQNELENLVDVRTNELSIKTHELEKLVNTDTLTGASNRRQFNELFHTELSRYERYQRSFSLLILDIDFFKQVNDNFGHDIGDKVLIEFSNLIKTKIRGSDSFARWGGEEFIILAPETDNQAAQVLANNLLQVIRENEFIDVGKLTASIGINTAVGKIDEKLFFKATDEALYKAKEKGRDQFVVA